MGRDFAVERLGAIPCDRQPESERRSVAGGTRGRAPAAGGITIGRSAINQLQLRDPGVSREHAMLTFLHGKVYIRDRGSSLGTYINGQRLGDKSRELAAGDRIAIGRSDVFEFRPG